MATLSLSRQENVHIIELINGDNDNSLNLDVLAEWNSLLDKIQGTPGDLALLVESRHPKTFCNGIDLEWLMQQSQETQASFVQELDNLLLRLATLDMPTVFAINGNCYAGGALLASTADFRYMRADKGRFCFPEVKIKLAFTPVMLQIVQLLPNLKAQYELSVTADAWGGTKCAKHEIIDEALTLETLHDKALEKAKELSKKHRPTFTKIKRGLRDKVTQLAQEKGIIDKTPPAKQ